MCLVIDACCLSRVFNVNNKEHYQFGPVYKWVRYGRGRMIYGGTKYLKELKEVKGLSRLLTELEKQRRVEILPKTCVDSIAEEIAERVNDKQLNDEHLIAIVIASRCRIVCTDDQKAFPFIRRSDLYRKYGAKRPSIYRYAKKHENMCCDRNVVEYHTGAGR
jgi:hypothetical protein